MKEKTTKSVLFIVFSLVVIIAAYLIIKSGSARDGEEENNSSNKTVQEEESPIETNNSGNNLTNSQETEVVPEDVSKEKIVIYFFYGEGCPYCEKQKDYFDDLKKDFKNIEIKSFEVYGNKSNYQKFIDMAKAYNTEVEGVPMTFIGDKYWRGFADYIGEEIEEYLQGCTDTTCPDPATRL